MGKKQLVQVWQAAAVTWTVRKPVGTLVLRLGSTVPDLDLEALASSSIHLGILGKGKRGWGSWRSEFYHLVSLAEFAEPLHGPGR